MNHARFREDLYFRLSVVTVRIPPLRERIEDLPLLVNAFLDAFDALDKQHLFTPAVLAEMAESDWPGNVRELKNHVERAVVLMDASVAPPDDLGPPSVRMVDEPVNLDVPFKAAKERLISDFERRYLGALMAWAGGT